MKFVGVVENVRVLVTEKAKVRVFVEEFIYKSHR